MKRNIITAAALALVATLSAGPATAANNPKLTGEAKLAKMLEGRVAGKPVSCLPLNRAAQSTIIDGTAIVYRSGSTLYVNRPTNAQTLDRDDVMVTQTSMSQLCRLDVVQLHDRTNLFWNGFVGLQDFVPYRRADAAS